MHSRRLAILSVLAILCLSALPAAQPPAAAGRPYTGPRTPDGKPNLNGIWQAINTANWDIEAHSAGPSPVLELGAAGAVPGGLGVVEGEPQGGLAGRPDDPLQPEAGRGREHRVGAGDVVPEHHVGGGVDR